MPSEYLSRVRLVACSERFGPIVVGVPMTTDAFADEEVSSNWGYLSGYGNRTISLKEQAALLLKTFPEFEGVTFDASLQDMPLPKGAENPVILPNWRLLDDDYGRACQKVFRKVHEVYGGKAVNYLEHEGGLTEKHLREGAQKRAAMEQIRKAQKGHDFLVVTVQLGFLHRGRSVRRARVVMRDSGQFGLGLFEILILLLTHSNRLKSHGDLGIDCAGDEVSLKGDGRFTRAPFVKIFGRVLKVRPGRIDYMFGSYGSASGFLL